MKSLTVFLVLMLFALSTYAQSTIAYHPGNKKGVSDAVYVEAEKGINFSAQHTQSAMQKMRKHLLDNIEYPEVMQQYGFEGTGVVEVKVAESGALEEVKIIKSVSPFFDRAILGALESLHSVVAKGQRYEGHRKMQLPVIFSIR